MGQKINPIGFRLGTNQDHHSIWFEEPKNYSAGVQEDQKLRNYMKMYIEKKIKKSLKFQVITRIEIHKLLSLIEITAFLGFSARVVERNRKKSEKLRKEQRKEMMKLQENLHKEFHFIDRITGKNIKFNVCIRVPWQPYQTPTSLASYLADQLKQRVSFRKAIKKTIQLSRCAGTKSIQVKIAGRIGGKEIARVLCFKKGKLPLQTIRAKIDYCSYPVQTPSGILGIKIWTFKG